jgi:hypothetical protein
MMSAGLSRGWQAWLEMYEARTYALSRLQQAAAFLSKPELAASFSLWMRVWYAGVQKRIQAQAALKDLDLVNAASRCVELQAQMQRMKQEANELKDERDAAAWTEFDTRYRRVIEDFARSAGLGEDDATEVAQQTLVDFVSAYRMGRYSRDQALVVKARGKDGSSL